MALYCALAGWNAVRFASWQYALFALVAAVACVSAARLRSWSQFLVYLLAAVLLYSWAGSIHASFRVGYFDAVSRAHMLLSVAPEGFLVLLSAYCSFALYRQFRR